MALSDRQAVSLGGPMRSRPLGMTKPTAMSPDASFAHIA